MVTDTYQPSSNEASMMNELELTSIKALLAYTANEKKVSEELVREVLSARFGVDDMQKLPRRTYDDVIRFLVDIQVDMAHLNDA